MLVHLLVSSCDTEWTLLSHLVCLAPDYMAVFTWAAHGAGLSRCVSPCSVLSLKKWLQVAVSITY